MLHIPASTTELQHSVGGGHEHGAVVLGVEKHDCSCGLAEIEKRSILQRRDGGMFAGDTGGLECRGLRADVEHCEPEHPDRTNAVPGTRRVRALDSNERHRRNQNERHSGSDEDRAGADARISPGTS